MDPPALTCQAAGPTRGPQSKSRKTIGNLGHALDFVTIGKLGNALDFRMIGKLGNVLGFVAIGKIGNVRPIAKNANASCGQNALGGGESQRAKVIGQIGKIVMPKKSLPIYK